MQASLLAQPLRLDPQPGPLARRAALTLHALGPADRAWLLAQLPTAQREHLQGMLHELQTLGIPASRSLLQELLDAPDTAQAAPATPGEEFQQQQVALSCLAPAVVARILHTEPAGLVAQLLHSHPWPWRQAVMDQLGAARRRRVEEFLDGLRRLARPVAPVALHKALIAAMYRRALDAGDVLAPDAPLAQAAQHVLHAAPAGRGTARRGWLRFWPKGRA